MFISLGQIVFMVKPASALVVLLLAVFFASFAHADSKLFPKPSSLVPAVEFWKKVYTQATTSEGYLHDKVNMAVVYEKVILKTKGRRSQGKEIKKFLANYRAALRSLAKGKRTKLSALEKRALKALGGKNVSNKVFATAAKNVRFQRGQADKYKKGLIRSGAHIKEIRRVFTSMGLPARLAALPHVESSYNAAAYSHVGAAGMWQFMRSTGRRFMRIDHVVDERLDVQKATRAAAELLQHNYSVLKSWPLALTAYNHGLAGMRRAKRKTGTDDIGVIVEKYKSRTFGFASRNFYAAFLAASEVAAEPKKYFGKLRLAKADKPLRIKTKRYIPADKLVHELSLTTSLLRKLNPALRPSIWSGEKYIPKGYALRLPKSNTSGVWRKRLARAENIVGKSEQKPDYYYRVQRGDSLSTIARRYKTRVSTLMALNNLRSKHRIWIGQKLRLPGAAKEVVVAKQDSAKKDKRSVIQPLPGNSHIVKSGETISEIATLYGMNTRELLRLNNLSKRSLIRPGQQLSLKQATQIANATKTPNEEPLPKESIRSMLHMQSYRVMPGDTLSEIAARYQIPEQKLLAMNSLRPDAVIRPGQRIQLHQRDVVKPKAAETLAKLPETPAKEVMPQAASEQSSKVDKLAAMEPAVEVDGAQEAEQLAEGSLVDEEGSPVEAQSDLSADPSDYSVSKKGIEVQVNETLGHYADWLEIKTSALRRLNGLRFGKNITVGKRLRLDFSKVDEAAFVHRRENFHLALQTEYFDENVINGACTHKVSKGDSLWDIANKNYSVPFWLLRQYNPDITLESVLSRGQELQIPLVREKSQLHRAEMRSANGARCRS